MANRFERFFSAKRKASVVSSRTSTAPSSAPSSPTEPSTGASFPSPSFIRPKTSRMAAREEFRFKQPTKSSMDPYELLSERHASTDSSCSENTAAPPSLETLHAHSSTFCSDQREELASVLRGFEFPTPPLSRKGSIAPPGAELGPSPFPNALGYQTSRSVSPAKVEMPTSRLETPPSSEPEDSPLSQRRPKAKKLQIVPHTTAPVTPELFPEIGPVSDWQLHEHKPVDILDERLFEDFQMQLEKTFGESSFSQHLAQPEFLAPELHLTANLMSHNLSHVGEYLQEPDFDEFFSLSDDNVAEPEFENSASPNLEQGPATLTPSAPSLPLRDPPLLTLEHPCASRPAAVAAFEAARIASRYKFDMLYVVNLWPEAPSSQATAQEGPTDSIQGMTGRLLAAYGLHNGPSPFQISAEVHTKVLRSEGWVEYLDDKALNGDFSHAYACSFYPGQYEENRFTVGVNSHLKSTNAVDRGIVFAAYRKPGANGSIQYSNSEELAVLRRDVEAMVEMLIDVHVASRLRQPPLLTRYSNETGPMPIAI
ncbi:hypothetical protein ACO1O0_000510 [Amphichorda felina]